MTTSDWIIDIALIAVVLRQLRVSRIDARTVLVPLGLVGFSVSHYLTAIPTAGNDLVVIGAFALAGVLLGLVGGLATRVKAMVGGGASCQAGFVSAFLWVASMSARLGFVAWAESASGGRSLGRFSVAHDLTTADVWSSALIMMVLGEVLVRISIIVGRGRRVVLSQRASYALAA